MSQALEFGAVKIREPEYEMFEGLNRRSLHPIDSISRQLDFVCTTATDALQIAAALESDGVNDRIAREEYGFSDVFELAEELYRRVPLRPPEYLPRITESLARTILRLTRGFTIIPIGLMLLFLAGAFGARPVAIGTILALGATWFWALLVLPRDAQLMASSRADLARRKLGVSVGSAALASVLVAVGLTVLSSSRLDWILAQLGLSLLLLSGLVLIARSRETWLWLALAPGGLVGLFGLLRGGVPVWLGLGGIVVSVGLSLCAAWIAALVDTGNPSGPDAGFTPLEWPGVLAFSILSFALLALLTARAWGLGNGQLGLSSACAVLPLMLATGVLEWNLWRFQRWSVRSLSRVSSSGAFIRRVRWGFWAYVMVAAVVLIGLSGLILSLCTEIGSPVMINLSLLGANAALGLGFFSSALMIGRNRVRELLVPWGMALVACIAVLALGWTGFALLNAFLGACVLLMIWTAFLVWRSLGSIAG